jgi:hypothetical protein
MGQALIQRGNGTSYFGLSTNRLPKKTSGPTLADSLFSDDGTKVTLTSGQLLLPDGTAAAPALSFSAEGDLGIRRKAAGTLRIDDNSTGMWAEFKAFYWGVGYSTEAFPRTILDVNGGQSGFYFGPGSSTLDVALLRDNVANTLAQRNGTNAQKKSVYNTFTSTTNYERGVLDWISTANVFKIGTEKGSGGGTARPMAFVTDATERARLTADGIFALGTTDTTGAAAKQFVMTETTAPTAAAANNGILFLEDNGAGKTRLVIKFSSGAAQVIATEP